jgi:hypothetical protein
MKEHIDRLTYRVARWIGWHLPRKVATHAIDAEYDRRMFDLYEWNKANRAAGIKPKYRIDALEPEPVISLSTYSDDQLHTFGSSVFGFTEDLP